VTRLAGASAVAAVLSVLVLWASAASAASKATYYVSVGDSLAQGYQPIGGPFSPLGTEGYAQGYANQLFTSIRDRYEQLRLVKLGCGGETTLTMVLGAAYCGFSTGSQLAQAEAFLNAHRGEVALVTIDIGGNDVLQYGDQAVPTILTYMPQILARLRAATGPEVPIVGMTYYAVGLPDVWNATHDLTQVRRISRS
jgi:lysophospholipase L1-like esterase